MIGREGIELSRLKYSTEALAPEVVLGIPRVVRFDPRDLSHVYLEREGLAPMAVPLRDPGIPAVSLWEWRALQRTQREVVEHDDAECLRAAVISPAPRPLTVPETSLRTRRRAARAVAWREVQAISALPPPDTTMEPTMASNDAAAPFAWEVLE